jgi:hypothetical protein
MGFDFFSFLGGFSESVSRGIDEQNKEIRDRALLEFDRLNKQAMEQEEKNKTKRDELKQTASVLAAYKGKNNVGFTDDQIVGLLQNPAVAKRVIGTLDKNADDLGSIDFSQLYKVVSSPSSMSVADYINRSTTAPTVPATEEKPKQQMKGAFGLPTRAYEEAEARFGAATGKSVQELRTMARAPSELAAVKGELNLNQFANPDTLITLQSRLRDNIAKGESEGKNIGDILADPGNQDLMRRLRAASVIRNMFDEEKDKVRTTSQITSVFKESLRAGIDPLLVKGIVRFDTNSNDYVPITGDAKSIAEFAKHKNQIIFNQALSMGIVDREGKILGGRNAEDALLPYAEIKEGRIVRWRVPGESPTQDGEAKPKETPSTAPSVPPSSASPQNLPKPKTKAEYDAIPKGTRYIDTDGKEKIKS